jgi:hypothetical protein
MFTQQAQEGNDMKGDSDQQEDESKSGQSFLQQMVQWALLSPFNSV